MLHKDVYVWFTAIFPQYADKIKETFPCGKNTVRVRLHDQSEFVFNYENPTDWRLETIDSFIARTLKGE